ILSLGETHSFDREAVPAFLHSASVRNVLVQALLDAPMFAVRWRWNATIALAVQRMRNGKKLPPQWQRNQAEDLVAVVFPDQLACLENIRGEREIPDHPLVAQTIADCLHETMDIDGLERVLKLREQGEVEICSVDLVAPSPLAAEIINARPYAFLDDGDAENRRTRAISQQRNDLVDAAMLSIISRSAIEQVQAECWITPRNPDELHDGLLQLGFLAQSEFTQGRSSSGVGGEASLWGRWFQALAEDLRVSCVNSPDGRQWWVATERLAEFLALDGTLASKPDPGPAWTRNDRMDAGQALVELLRSRLSGLGPASVEQLAGDFGLPQNQIEQALLALQSEGYVMSMDSAGLDKPVWCERRLLARIHRYSREQRRQTTRAVSPASFMRFLLAWHGLEAGSNNSAAGLWPALAQLEGWTAPLAAWEPELLQSRCRNYSAQGLDQLFLSGQLAWFRPSQGALDKTQLIAATPITMVPRQSLAAWQTGPVQPDSELPATAATVMQLLQDGGAMFTPDLQAATGLLPSQLEQTLGLLVARGLITADAFSPLRWLARPEHQKRRHLRSMRRAVHAPGSMGGMLGRWSKFKSGAGQQPAAQPVADSRLPIICKALLVRYGVVFRAVLERESLLPPWRELLAYLRRMEDRGEVQGGRFVDGFSGEQFALPEAVGLLRNTDLQEAGDSFLVISATDPLNLGGIITSGVKTPAINNHRILLRNGLPVARLQGEAVEILDRKLRLSEEQARLKLSPVRQLRGLKSS
ncbi:MAG TPA: crosslink repair DNA glycosylase YcaQ family protein, partial [Xanthomonadales bacterium]|nr:crosslink repair DNA glycosylase YcaQ family protein [Xanthomonadales bacterium]